MPSFLFRKEIMNEKKQEDLILAIKTSIKMILNIELKNHIKIVFLLLCILLKVSLAFYIYVERLVPFLIMVRQKKSMKFMLLNMKF